MRAMNASQKENKMKKYYKLEDLLKKLCEEFPYEKMPEIHESLLAKILSMPKEEGGFLDQETVNRAWTNACIETL